MSAPHHDSAAFLEVVRGGARRGGDRGFTSGWFVRRICECHNGEQVSIPFATRAEAERCLRVLDEPRNRGPIR